MEVIEVQTHSDGNLQAKEVQAEDERLEEPQVHGGHAALLIMPTRRSKRLEEKRDGQQY